MDRVLTCMVSDRLGPGNLNGELVSAVCSYLGLEGGSALASYHTALTVAVESLGLAPGSSVVVSALSPALYLDVIMRLGLIPVVADVDEEMGTIDSQDVARLVQQGAAGLLVHYPLGLIPDVTSLGQLGVPMIEDLSHGVGGYLGEQRCGTFGQVAVVSLEPEAILTAAGGGIVAAPARQATRRLDGVSLTTHARLADLNAALALAQIREIEIFIAGRKQIAQVYARALRGSRHRAVLQAGEGENVYSAFPVMLESGMREVRRYARRKGVEAAAAFEGSILTTGSLPAEGSPDLPKARGVLMRCLMFPLYPALGKTRVEAVARVLSTLP
jgi:dTDP-4-amino-4,6-dideoxygalactose transaminase